MPSTMKAIKMTGPGEAKIQDVPLPKLRDDYILVKVVAVALNPTDWKHIQYLPTPSCTVGCDYAGVVEEVGKNVTLPFKKGDRVAGMVHGGNANEKEDGCFAEYCVAKGDVQITIPDNLSFEEASTLGIGALTVGQGLYQSLKLPLPNSPSKEETSVLVYGGSTATGALAIQLAKLSGCTVITTCSPHNFSHVKSLGASAAFDYGSPDCAKQIREHTHNRLTHAFDCISTAASAQICADALSTSTHAAYSCLLKVDFPRKDVAYSYTLVYTITGEPFNFGPGGKGPEFPAKKEDFEFAKSFFPLVRGLLEEGRLKVHRPNVRQGGLEGVFEGLEELKANNVSGEKLVYKIAEP
ncbi:hypothetical protein B0A49_02820 [Cryomyces minteri]|uniref:Enoyl reductase (ER) domain-containing protein n=1 Tax=Cryomyces minteri TaxID=331657 RepID=A0A4U0XH22_9PEZI|nr:hypothetical protein B0A49_02820 [Cryomyces minteri]